ncbi:MAG TPA: FkbM family methyltransferase [Acetobacteraceae bacterium]|nr:FkbM family methyltransferase [Acetobacteraceae bacterium]
MTVYDIGANVGYLTLVFSSLVGPSGHVAAFEPDPRTRRLLQQNICNNGAKNVRLYPYVVSDRNGIVNFATFEYSLVNHIATERTPADATVLSVQATSLDELVYGCNLLAPSVIKVDVEGAEERVLRGSSRILQRIKPVVIVETRSESYDSIKAMADMHGYSVAVLSKADMELPGQVADVLLVPACRRLAWLTNELVHRCATDVAQPQEWRANLQRNEARESRRAARGVLHRQRSAAVKAQSVI